MKTAPKPWKPTNADRLMQLMRLGLPLTRIADLLGTSRQSIARAVKRYHIAAKEPPPPPKALSALEAHPAHNECRWIHDNGPWINRPPDWCKKPTAPGSPYCPQHAKRSYTRN